METLLTQLIPFLTFILYMVVGYGAVRTALVIWFESNFAVHVFKCFCKDAEIYTRDELGEALISRVPDWLAELLECPICLSVWVSIAAAVFSTLTFDLPIWYPIAGVVYWPGKFWIDTKNRTAPSKPTAEAEDDSSN